MTPVIHRVLCRPGVTRVAYTTTLHARPLARFARTSLPIPSERVALSRRYLYVAIVFYALSVLVYRYR